MTDPAIETNTEQLETAPVAAEEHGRKLSAKTLAELAMENYCPRCFWVKTRMPTIPFSFFPGIFATIDSQSKMVFDAWRAAHPDLLPAWLSQALGGDLGAERLPAPHHSKFCIYDEATGLKLTGTPDDMFRLSDGTLVILDYKTARITDTVDRLAPLYRAQLNTYAEIAERLGMGQVSRLGLVYFEPVGDIRIVPPVGRQRKAREIPYMAAERLYGDGGFILPFSPTFVPVDRDPALVDNLAGRAKELFDAPAAPEGLDGCKNCLAVDQMVNLITGENPGQE